MGHEASKEGKKIWFNSGATQELSGYFDAQSNNGEQDLYHRGAC